MEGYNWLHHHFLNFLSTVSHGGGGDQRGEEKTL